MKTGTATRAPRISVITPALNEIALLPNLLACLERQTFTDFEFILADAGSTDGTRELAERHGAVVVDGGMPARGRNAGAAVARGELLCFLDADVQIPDDFLANIWDEMERKFVDLATCEARPVTEVAFDKAIFRLSCRVIQLTAKTDPRTTGYCILVTRRLFRRVGGFDESIRLGEDHAFSKAASRFRPMEYLTSTHVKVSVRRLEKEGRVAYIIKAIHSDLHRKLIGEIRRELIDYEFDQWGDDDDDDSRAGIVELLDRWLLQADDALQRSVRAVRDVAAPGRARRAAASDLAKREADDAAAEAAAAEEAAAEEVATPPPLYASTTPDTSAEELAAAVEREFREVTREIRRRLRRRRNRRDA